MSSPNLAGNDAKDADSGKRKSPAEDEPAAGTKNGNEEKVAEGGDTKRAKLNGTEEKKTDAASDKKDAKPQDAVKKGKRKSPGDDDGSGSSDSDSDSGSGSGSDSDGSGSDSGSDSDSDSDDSDLDKPLVAMKKKVAPKPAAKKKVAAKPKPKAKAKAAKKKQKKESSDDDSSSSSSDDDSSSSDSSDSSDSSSDSSDEDRPRRRRKVKGTPRVQEEVFDPDLYDVMGAAEPLKPEKGANKWWKRNIEKKDGVCWTTLKHNGILFPEPYEPHGVKMLYDGKPVDLTPEQEEVATWYAVMLESDHVQKPVFNANFFKDWQKLLGKDHVIQKLSSCDFTPIKEYAEAARDRKKEERKKPEVRKEEKQKNDALNATYGWALVDGFREKVGNFKVEIPGLFRGRGEHPKTGKIKKRIVPEDVTLNIGRGEAIPKCPIPGHKWKGIVHNTGVTWLAYWKDNINNAFKYVYLASNSKFKGEADRNKYEKARKLKDAIGAIRSDYETKMKSKSSKTDRQLGTAAYLIDRLALRVGNEKNTDEEADTVGCCSLRVEHLSFAEPKSITFDFLGKDSMRYFNTVEVTETVFKNLKEFCQNKDPEKEVFDAVDSSRVNQFFKEHMDGLTAKVFRTYNASITLQEELRKKDANVTPESSVTDKCIFYTQANTQVAILCNHQRAIPKSHGASVEKLSLKIQELEEHREELKAQLKAIAKGKPKDQTKAGKKLSSDAAVIRRQLVALEKRLENEHGKMTMKDNTKQVSLSTSKINYMDPRITVAWCKDFDVPIEKCFPKSMAAKFPWAMEEDPDWRF